MPRSYFAQIKRQQIFAEQADIIRSLSREKIELAEFMEQETQLDFEQAMKVIDQLCTEILPCHQGIGKLIAFRNEIRDPIKESIAHDIEYDEWRDHIETQNSVRPPGY